MADPIGTAMAVGHLLKRAYNFYDACRAAPSEFKAAARHAKCMALVLESIDADLIQNKQSSFHQRGSIAQARRAQLKTHIRACKNHLTTLELLLKDYRRHTVGWAVSGKAKVMAAQADLMMATTELNTFMTAQGLNVLGRVEIMLALIMKRLDINYPSMSSTDRRRRKKLAGAWVAGQFISKMRRVLSGVRRQKRGTGGQKRRPHSSLRPIIRMNTSPNLKTRKILVEDYVKIVLNDGTYKAITDVKSNSHYECWRVAKSSTPFSPGVYGAEKQHRRGQLEIREMASAFAGAGGNRLVGPQDGSAKYVQRLKRKSPCEWEFVAGRIESKEVSGVVINQRAMIIVKRRK
ncbi:hypothetical protein EJ08DRAFT_653183 [Tothia fuscella]|uniref:Uncharacterized protein n=1 Tax=Tothia fuscella TaxID=1048955 RepID=A0A9P4NI17_9PEZI|nr:hypothetical protein EJ08DRAFT_653183 [Tothia fuscella]